MWTLPRRPVFKQLCFTSSACQQKYSLLQEAVNFATEHGNLQASHRFLHLYFGTFIGWPCWAERRRPGREKRKFFLRCCTSFATLDTRSLDGRPGASATRMGIFRPKLSRSRHFAAI